MNNESLSLRPVTGRQIVDRQGYLRAERTRVGAWLANGWRRLLTAGMLIEIPLQLDTYYRYDLDDAQFGAISGFNISLTTLCLILLYLQWLPRVVVESRAIRISKPLLAYFGLVACSLLWTGSKSRTLFELFLLLQACLIFIYLANNLKTKRDILFAMTFLTVGLAVQGLLMSATKVLADDLEVGPLVFDYLNRTGRVAGSFGSPNVAASSIALLLVPSLSLLLTDVSKWLKLVAALAAAMGCFALVATLSRGGWLATAISMIIFGTVAIGKGWVPRWLLAAGLVAAVIGALVFYQPLAARLLEDDGGSLDSRTPLIELSLAIAAEHPLGAGANTWDLAVEQQAATGRYRGDWFFFVHNKYALVLAEIGWMGLLAYLSFLVSIVIAGWRGLKSCDRSLAPLLLALTAAFVGQQFHMAFDIFNSRVQVQMLCVVAGLIVAMTSIQSDEGSTQAVVFNPHRKETALAGVSIR